MTKMISVRTGTKIPLTNLDPRLRQIFHCYDDGSVMFALTHYRTLLDLYNFEKRNEFSRKGFRSRYGFNWITFMNILKKILKQY